MTDQDIITAIAKVVKVKADNCRDCKGSGKVSHEIKLDNPQSIKMDDIVVDCGTRYDIIPCPTCAPLRELEKELCWHEEGEMDDDGYWVCKHCAIEAPNLHEFKALNPNLTTTMKGSRLLIIYLLKEAGMWDEFDGFERWMWKTSGSCQPVHVYIDGEKLVSAIGTWLEGGSDESK